MKAIQCTQLGAPDALELTDLDAPTPGPGDVNVAVRAAGVNFADILLIAGQYQEKPETPFTPGMEFAGDVVAVGPGVANIQVGDRVVGVAPKFGAFAEHLVTSAALVLRIPDTMDYAQAAALPVAYGTAHLALTHRAQIQAGETLLALGAAGGVGLAAVEIGARLGARVIAAASTPEKLDLAKQYGATYAINYTEDSIRDRVLKITGNKGVDVIFDPVGGPAFDEAARAIAWEGRLLIIGFASGEIPQFAVNYALVKNFSLVGVYWGRYGQQDPATLLESLSTLLEWFESGWLKPHISATFSIDDTANAMNALVNRTSTGKTVITMD